MMKFRQIGLLLLSVLIVGCNAPAGTVESTTKLPPTGNPTLLATENTLVPPTERPSSLSCPIPLGAPPLPELSSSKDWAMDVLSYLNQGGSITAFIEALPSLGQSDPHGPPAILADLNGDRLEDLAIALAELVQERLPGESALLIYLCDQDQYRLVYASSSLPDSDRVHLRQAVDLTGDGVPEIMVMQEFCGAHTCFQAWEVLHWQSNQFVNILDGRTDDLPSPIVEVSARMSDGSMTLTITGQGVQSVGAGPSRPNARVWHWSMPEVLFVVIEEQLAAPTFRIHALHDADQAALTGDFSTAMSSYNRVIEDPALDDYPFGEEGQARLSAYALFRSMLLWIEKEDLTQAETTLIFLQAAYPPDGLGGGYSAIADEVWRAYQAQPDLVRACQIAQAFAQEHIEDILDPLNYGYANKRYLAFDICPYAP